MSEKSSPLPKEVHRYIVETPDGDLREARVVWSERKVREGVLTIGRRP